VRGLDEDRVGAWLAEHVVGAGPPFSYSLIAGGHSNLTFRVTGGDGQRFVLRRPPLGHVLATAHDMAREHRVMTALRDTVVPVPVTYALCEDTDVVGAVFYVMEKVAGAPYRSRKELEALGPARTRAISERLVDTLVALHAVDPAAVGLADFGRPEGFLSRQVSRWKKQMDASHHRDLPAADELHARLAASVPPEGAAGIVHGDFRLDNLVFAHDAPKVVAVLDWELSTLGDPMADFAYHCMAWQLPPPFRGLGDLSRVQLAALGLPSEECYLARYCERRRLPAVTTAAWRFYTAFNLFRAAAIAQGIMGRALAGNASNAHALEAGKQARQLAELGWQRAAQV
jgi:aminoglycoside phosphotransferase (APT) family kinase protein